MVRGSSTKKKQQNGGAVFQDDFPAARFGWRRGGCLGASQSRAVLCGELHLVLHCRHKLGWPSPMVGSMNCCSSWERSYRVCLALRTCEPGPETAGAAGVVQRARRTDPVNCVGPQHFWKLFFFWMLLYLGLLDRGMLHYQINNCFCLHCSISWFRVRVRLGRVNIVSGGGLDVHHPLATPQFHGKRAQFKRWKGARRHTAAFACSGAIK
ncbi:uncharacterized protein VSU04_011717 isoform 1-T1 [Chlamydotis macqueenii]